MSNPRVDSRFLLRLSSLGDVILASSALTALGASEVSCFEGVGSGKTDQVHYGPLDWATTAGYSELLQSHPLIRRVYEYDRETGLQGWVQFCRRSWDRHYTEVLDLHGNLRTLIMRVLFFYWGCLQPQFKPRWKTVSKERFRLYGYFIFKGFWPERLRPSPWVERFTRLAGGTGRERPNLEHLLKPGNRGSGGRERNWERGMNQANSNQANLRSQDSLITEGALPADFLIAVQKQTVPVICVMPASKWDGKKWPGSKYVQLLKTYHAFPIVLGSQSDAESKTLCELLTAAQIPHYSGVGKWNLTQTACVLAMSKGYLGSDTGLAHLAEAVGVSAQVIYGPTTPDMGFAPWRPESVSIGKAMGCRPCGKDGRFCFRVFNRYSCLKDLSTADVLGQLK